MVLVYEPKNLFRDKVQKYLIRLKHGLQLYLYLLQTDESELCDI